MSPKKSSRHNSNTKTEPITEKKLKNKRFRKTEDSIIGALFLTKDTLSLKRLIKIAGISRSTLYRHHRNIYEIVPNYEKYIIRKTNLTFKRLMKLKKIHLRTLYVRLLVFMVAHQKIILLIAEFGHYNFTEKIIRVLEPKIITVSKITNQEILDIHIKEIVSLIEQWQQEGFSKEEIPAILDKIMYLTSTAHLRLSPLSSFSHH